MVDIVRQAEGFKLPITPTTCAKLSPVAAAAAAGVHGGQANNGQIVEGAGTEPTEAGQAIHRGVVSSFEHLSYK